MKKIGKQVVETIRFENERNGRLQLLIFAHVVYCSSPELNRLECVHTFEWKLFTRIHSNSSLVQETLEKEREFCMTIVGDLLFERLAVGKALTDQAVKDLFIEVSKQQGPETPVDERITCKQGKESVVFVLEGEKPWDDLARICARMNNPRPVSRP